MAGITSRYGLTTLSFIFVFLITVNGLNGTEMSDRKYTFMVTFPAARESYGPYICILPLGGVPVNVTVTIVIDKLTMMINRTLVTPELDTIHLPPGVITHGKQGERKGIWIDATGEVDIFSSHPEAGNAATFHVLPISHFGTDYVISGGDQLIRSVVIAGVERETNIQITGLHHFPRLGNLNNISLHQMESLILETDTELTGVHVTSDQLISVIPFIGNDSDSDHVTCSHQLLPVKDWGRSFVTLRMSRSDMDDYISVFGGFNTTELIIREDETITERHLGPGEVITFRVGQEVSLDASGPIAVYQRVVDPEVHPLGNTTHYYLPSLESWRAEYLVDNPSDVIMYVIARRHDVKGILLDGRPINVTFKPEVGTSAGNVTSLRFRVPAGRHRVSHHVINTTFALVRPVSLPCVCCHSVSPACLKVEVIHGVPGTEKSEQAGYVILDDDVTTKVNFHIEADRGRNVINFHEADSLSYQEEGMNATFIAVIVSLASAVFFVIVCLLGFVLAEVSCRREASSTSKVSPLSN